MQPRKDRIGIVCVQQLQRYIDKIGPFFGEVVR